MEKAIYIYVRCLCLFMLFGGAGCQTSKPSLPEAVPQKVNPPRLVPSAAETYRERYPLRTAKEKLVDNQGKGFSSLAGTRNFRAVLNGVYYRGGGDNKFRLRANENPLPTEGLRSLCEEGFTEAVYLYAARFETAPKLVHCRTFGGKENELRYHQVSALSGKRAGIEALLTKIHQHIRNPALGPIYAHCWNGWHASGFVAASALRQFCGFSAEEALAYWVANTDGNENYPKVKKLVTQFEPMAGLEISAEEKKALCPEPGTLSFATSGTRGGTR